MFDGSAVNANHLDHDPPYDGPLIEFPCLTRRLNPRVEQEL